MDRYIEKVSGASSLSDEVSYLESAMHKWYIFLRKKANESKAHSWKNLKHVLTISLQYSQERENSPLQSSFAGWGCGFTERLWRLSEILCTVSSIRKKKQIDRSTKELEGYI